VPNVVLVTARCGLKARQRDPNISEVRAAAKSSLGR
jgi:hypothetical protein